MVSTTVLQIINVPNGINSNGINSNGIERTTLTQTIYSIPDGDIHRAKLHKPDGHIDIEPNDINSNTT